MEEFFSKYFNDLTIRRLVIIVVGITAIWFLLSLLQKRFFSKIKDIDGRYKAKKISTFAGYLFTILLLLFVYSDKLGGFGIALGVAGAGIAFALQEVIASFAGWLAILFGGFYKTGDRVQLGGIKGDVMDIGLLRTTIMETGQWVDGDLYNGRIVLVANSFVFKEPVFNYSGDFPFLWDEIKIPVKYGSDYTKTTEMLIDVGKEVVGELTSQSMEDWDQLQRKYRLENALTEPMVSLVANDNWVEFTLRYVVEYKMRRTTKTALFTRILKAVEDSEGAISFASATFQVVDAQDLNVHIRKD